MKYVSSVHYIRIVVTGGASTEELNCAEKEELEDSEDEDSQSNQVWCTQVASIQTWLDKGLLASRRYVGLHSCNERQEPVSCRLSLPNGLLRIGIVNEEPPYAEPHVRWCVRSENESRKKTTSFSSYSIFFMPSCLLCLTNGSICFLYPYVTPLLLCEHHTSPEPCQ